MTRRIGERHPHAPAPLLVTAALALLLAGANAGLAWADELPANEPAKQQTPQAEALPQDAESNASANTTSTPDASAKNGTEAADAAASASASSAATSNGANMVSEQAHKARTTAKTSTPAAQATPARLPLNLSTTISKAKPRPTSPTRKTANRAKHTGGRTSTVPDIGSTTARTHPKTAGATSMARGITSMPQASCKRAPTPRPTARFGTRTRPAP